MLAQMSPYTPSLYQPGGYGRYRQYPRQVVTSIPGAGYDVGDMVWAEQELNLDGSDMAQPYGDYAQVPLRGLGLPMLATTRLPLFTGLQTAATTTNQSAPSPQATVEDVVNTTYQAPPPIPPVVSPSFFDLKVGPVPVWALSLGGVAAAAGAGWWWLRRKKSR